MLTNICNLNCLYRKNGVTSLTGFLQSVSANSFSRNNHGCGIYTSFDDKVIKSIKLIDYSIYKNQIENSKTVLTHQRYSTSGFEVKYNHPFENDDFVFLHNGVMNQFLNGSGSDSSGFFNKFTKEFNKNKSNLTRQNKIVGILKSLFLDNEGSYSILIYDKKTKNSYYFRNSPEIHFYKNDDYLFITTEEDNKIFLPMISNKKFVELEIKKRIIYHINQKSDVYILDSLPEIVVPKEEKFELKNQKENNKYYEESEWDAANKEIEKEIKGYPCWNCGEIKEHNYCWNCGKKDKNKNLMEDLTL